MINSLTDEVLGYQAEIIQKFAQDCYLMLNKAHTTTITEFFQKHMYCVVVNTSGEPMGIEVAKTAALPDENISSHHYFYQENYKDKPQSDPIECFIIERSIFNCTIGWSKSMLDLITKET